MGVEDIIEVRKYNYLLAKQTNQLTYKYVRFDVQKYTDRGPTI